MLKKHGRGRTCYFVSPLCCLIDSLSTVQWHVLWSPFPLRSSSESGAGGRSERRLSELPAHSTGPAPSWLSGQAPGKESLSCSQPLPGPQRFGTSSECYRPSLLSSILAQQWPVAGVDSGWRKVAQKIALPEHIKLHCTSGRWIVYLLGRMKNSGFKLSQGLLLDRLFIYYPVSQQTLGEYPDAIMGAELERCVTMSSAGSVGSCSTQIQQPQGQL